ncbi:TonB-dependent receptor plug domain-containing protein [Rubrivivax gelatinosus]|uniref:TonB-dependent receptor plug domain-containing protein n=1 Tax=Rubrivivax gelatinosus TaxID=28068 RepID=UPI001389AE37|nr:TonB-dependent receptor [Rubrivivax gelatinosus]MBG6082458.1 outer membrane receptor protein involved in Fe transport [Rubrivivax gelatinosus]
MLLAAVAWPPSLWAQATVGADSTATQSIQVTGKRLEDDRRDAPNAKYVVTKKDIERFGDQRLGDVLKRVPGLSVTGSGAQAGEIRMRGLGNGYTQVLIDGEPVPAGFSLDGLSPSLVERVEVLRSGTSDLGGQGIAGTINIILRRGASDRPVTEVSSSLGEYRGLGSGELALNHSRKAGSWSYGVGLSASRERNRWPSTVDQSSRTADGGLQYVWHTEAMENGTANVIAVTPRAQWQNEQHKFQAEGLLESRRFLYSADERRTTVFGSPPTYDVDRIETKNQSDQFKGSLTYTGQLGTDNRVEAKLSAARFSRASDSTLDGESPAGRPVLHRNVTSDLTDDSVSLRVSDKIALGDSHALGTGIETSRARREETRIQRDRSDTGFPTLDLDEDFTATVDKRALYLQDEWAPSERLSMYAGVRHEELDTDVRGPTLSPVTRQSSVTSPTAQVVWKVTKADQLRLAWGRSYKPPRARDLVPRRWVNNENSAANPNFEGNPALLPELSENIDLGFERYLADGGFLGANWYWRTIRDVVLTSVFQRDGVWVAVPTNGGRARVQGLELEAKGKVPTIWPAVPQINARAAVAFNRSQLDRVPGPDNRLAEQPRASASWGADLPLPGGAWTLGASFSYESGGRSRTSVTQTVERSPRRKLDAYATWAADANLTLRLSLGNLLAPDSVVTTTYDDGQIAQQQTERRPSDTTVRVRLEARF